MAPIKLPRYVMFKGDNGNNLCHYLASDGTHPYLYFNSTNRDLLGSHEVIPVTIGPAIIPGGENVVMVKSVYNQKFWRRSPNWIWADQSQEPSSANYDCLFMVVQLNPNTVALQCLANMNFVKRLTHGDIKSCLNASAPDCSNDITAQLEVSEALSTRRVFDVEYLMDLLQTTDMKPLVLGSATAKNNTHYNTDLAVTVEYEISESSTWSNSTTFSTGLSVTVTAGIPDIASASSTVSEEFSYNTEMGKENGTKTSFKSTYTVKDVEPGDQVTVRVSGTQATGTVPYKYNFQDTRVDGLIMPVDTGVDGIFEGVQVVDIKWEATDSSGTRKEIKLCT